jgi:drug/metabolite transporter (DMT)-like permease
MGCVGGGVAVSGELADAPLFSTQAVRYSLAAVLLVCAARLAGRRVVRPRGAEWAWLAGVAALGLVLFNVALVRGSAHAEPAVLGVAVACVPVVLAIADPLLGGRRPRPTALVGAAVVTAGAMLVQGGGSADRVGIAWAVTVLVCEVGFTLLAVPVLGRHGPWGVAVHSCWLAAVMLWALGGATEGRLAVLTLRPAHLLVVGYLALVLTALAFVLWYSAVAGLGSARAGLLTGVAPVAAVGVGVLLGAPVPGIAVWAGIALVGVGLAVGLRAPTFERHRSRLSPRFATSRA